MKGAVEDKAGTWQDSEVGDPRLGRGLQWGAGCSVSETLW